MRKLSLHSENVRILLHLFVWACVFLFPYVFEGSYTDRGSWEREGGGAFRTLDTVTNLFWVGMFYLNATWAVPALLYRKRYIWFILAQLLFFITIMLLHGALFEFFVPGRKFNFLNSSGHNLLAFFFTLTVSTSYKLISDRAKADAASREIQKENLQTELSFLRSQISPHFIFNVLNNLVALSRTKSEDLEPTIIKLSGLMQYMLYETDHEKVLLKSEVEYLQSYIDLQKQRFSERLTVEATFRLQEDWHTLEPMLLIPFVENAFKHGTGMIQNPEIHICLKASENQLAFQVKNKFVASESVKDRTSGIGLANVRRRLELLYADSHRLTLRQDQGWFTVSLNLTFKA